MHTAWDLNLSGEGKRSKITIPEKIIKFDWMPDNIRIEKISRFFEQHAPQGHYYATILYLKKETADS